ncbi:hypothetical protein [Fibrivirga algicola]|uniref:Glycosyltransferase family 61 protein n=1 Tax=Fibrivirga algicola TaxID=2950420 RepID=A0ABX0QIH8_9BACT|nr:hypothetical protein [Fibrivirga algicola]NID10742.1 hypothetical protein [Fibrivirga algicola]
MIQLSPDLTYPTQCPACNAANPAGQVRFAGAVTLAESTCPVCATLYHQTLPIGQFNRFPVAVSYTGQHVRVAGRGRWLLDLVTCCAQPAPRTEVCLVSVVPGRGSISVTDQPSAIILLVCLDACYGHALMLLFNAQRHHDQHPDRPTIAIVPRSLVWLVPDYVAEIWVVDTPLAALNRPIPGLDAFINQQLARFKTVWLSHGYNHFDHRTIRFADFTRTPKFDLNHFDQDAVRQITFVLREDRLWLRFGWERLAYRVSQRVGLVSKTRSFWIRWQVRRYRQLASHLQQLNPVIQLSVTGLTAADPATGFGASVNDLRLPSPLSPVQERTWCAQYARSHVVVGVHGSGMLLPTSLAAGFVNLLPPDKLAHYAEDVLLAHDNPIHQTLLGRFLPTGSSPRQVAALLNSLLIEFPVWLNEARQR